MRGGGKIGVRGLRGMSGECGGSREMKLERNGNGGGGRRVRGMRELWLEVGRMKGGR